MKKIDISKLPELKTSVAIYGSARHQEVGGTWCAAAIVAIVSG